MRAGGFEAFSARLNEARTLYRATMGHLRAGQPAEAEAQLKQLIALWTDAVATYRSDPPGPFARASLFPEVLEGAASRLKRADEALAGGRTEAALDELAPLKRDWTMLRRSAGLYGLVECLDEASETLEAFAALRKPLPDLARTETRGDIIAKAAVYRYALKRCEAFAALDAPGDPEYRRLTDAIAAALDVGTSALRLRDPVLLERVLTDLKAFDTQLSQRYGG